MISPALQQIQQAKQNRSTFLDLGNCGLTELPNELFELPWLESINLGPYYSSDGRSNHTSVNVGKLNSLKDNISELSQFSKLREIYIGNNNITNIDFVLQMPQLQLLDLSNNDIRDIEFLKRVHELKYLFIGGNQIADISSLSGLLQLKSLNIGNNKISDISPLARLSNLQHLFTSNNNIFNISCLSDLSQLRTLYISNNKVKDLSSLKGLSEMQSLFLDTNEITDVSSLVGLAQLKSLNIGSNKITDITALDNLLQLQYLFIGNNNISSIKCLSRLFQLQTLYANKNQIKDLAPLKKLSEIIILELSDNEITDVGTLSFLIKIKSISIGNNQIADIKTLSRLPHLEKLDVSNTLIRDSSCLIPLFRLKSLYLNTNKISDISALANLRELETLFLGNNEIVDIGVLSKLPHLQVLFLSFNKISDIEVLSCLPRLKSLFISNNRLKSIGVLYNLSEIELLEVRHANINDIGVLIKLSKIQSLDLSNNNISDISVLAKLPNLHSLELDTNNISDISVLEQLTQLNSLGLNNNHVSDINVIAKLPQLQSLYLGGNKIADISVLSSLHKLKRLALNNNIIEDARALSKLPKIKMINLCYNNISDISPLLPLLSDGHIIKWSAEHWKGEGIYVKDCPISTPPIEIVHQGNDAILNFFKQIEDQGGTVPLYEAKLIMVGEPEAGKTSLTEKLIDENHRVVADDPKKKYTLGINVRENWRFADSKRLNEYFTAHIWDFGGQEIQYMTHQFFLTPESLYVLVADDRKQHTLFPYWFEVINLLGKDDTGNNSPVLVVLNERNHRSITNFDLNEYRKKYQQMRIDMLEVDLSEADLGRFRIVRDKIQQSLCTLSHIGRQLPRMWSAIRKEVIELNNNRNHINENEFAEICAKFNVTQAEDRQLISKYLHQLGVILHFQNDIQLRDFIIINPSWALKAVYAVLEDKEVQNRDGRFTEADLNHYWEDLESEERVKILNLMKKDSFEICYPVGNQTYIAPQLLPRIRPNFKWNANESLKCHLFYPFMPKGIMTRLIVRKHEYLSGEKLVWARGAVFQRFDCHILVTEEETERNGLIAVEVAGPASSRIRALDFIRNEIEDIHNKWFSNIPYEERAPCNCEDCLHSEKPTFFNRDKLVQRLEQNRKTIECDNNHVKDVEVVPLLAGIYNKERIDSLLNFASTSIDHFEPRSTRVHRIQIKPPFISQVEVEQPRTQESTPINESTSPTTPVPAVKTKNWYLVTAAALAVLIFFVFARPGSKLDFLGWFKAEQGGTESSKMPAAEEKPKVPLTATVIGSIKINNRNANAEDVKQVYIKGVTAGQRVTLDNNIFRLRNVKVPSDRLITIAIDLKDGRSASELFELPEANENNVVDLGEVLLETKRTGIGSRPGGKGSTATIIINNQNIQRNE